MSCPITTTETSNLVTYHEKAWLSRPSTWNLEQKVGSLKYARWLLEKRGKTFDTGMVASLSYLDQYIGPGRAAAAADEDNGAIANHLRQTARLLFPTPQDFADFMKLSATVEKKEGVDHEVYFSQVALIYISAFAETWNSGSMARAHTPEEAPSWKRFATEIDIRTVFGSEQTPQMSLRKPRAETQVDPILGWVGNVIDMAVRLEAWEGTSTCRDPHVYRLSKWLGMR